MENLYSFERKNLGDLIKTDSPSIVPDPGIAERLNYYFMLKNQKLQVHSNSFTNIFSWLFSFKNIVLKTGIAVFFISFLFFRTQINNNPVHSMSDSCNSQYQLTDTNFVLKDTCK